MILREQAPSNAALVQLACLKMVGLLFRPQKVLRIPFSTEDLDRFKETCFTLITPGQIRGLLSPLRP